MRLRRPEGREALERYTTRLLTELPTKNGDTIAQVVPGTSVQRLQEFLINRQWDEEDLNPQRVHKMIPEATTADGMLIVDDTGFAKQGPASVGIALHYSGTLGKVANCQVAISLHGTSAEASCPLNWRLFLPKEWIDDLQGAAHVRVPPGTPYQSQTELALDLIDQVQPWEVPTLPLVADAFYGDDFGAGNPCVSGSCRMSSRSKPVRASGPRIRTCPCRPPKRPAVRASIHHWRRCRGRSVCTRWPKSCPRWPGRR